MKKKIFFGTIIFLVILSIGLTFTLKPSKGNKNKFNSSTGQIAIININGAIVSGTGEGGIFSQGGAGSQKIINQIKEIEDDDDIEGVVFRIDSPGGSAAASQEVGEAIQDLKDSGKIVYTSMGDVAASGGYWIAAKTDKIYANPATMTGSIGVIIEIQNLAELYKKVGVKPQIIKSGKHKDIGSSSRPLDNSEKNILQSMVMDIYDQFVDVVVEGRKIDRKEILKIADGRVFTGRQALKLKLIDELGTMDDAINDLAQELDIEGEPDIYQFEENPFDKFFGLGTKALNLPINTGLSPEENKILKELLQTYQSKNY